MRFIIIRDHADKHPVSVIHIGTMTAVVAVEQYQRKTFEKGEPNGVTWKFHEGDFVSGLIAGRSL